MGLLTKVGGAVSAVGIAGFLTCGSIELHQAGLFLNATAMGTGSETQPVNYASGDYRSLTQKLNDPEIKEKIQVHEKWVEVAHQVGIYSLIVLAAGLTAAAFDRRRKEADMSKFNTPQTQPSYYFFPER